MTTRALLLVAGLGACTVTTDLSNLSSGANADPIRGDDDDDSATDGGATSKIDGRAPPPDGSSPPRVDGGGPVPVGDWPFDEGTGMRFADRSGRGHDGTANGGSWGPDKTGATSAFVLASGDQHVSVPGHADFDRPAGAKITMMGWARADEAPDHAYIIDVGFGSEGYGIELRTPTVMTYWDGKAHTNEATIPNVVGAWHHYGLVIDGDQARLYFDGSLVKAGSADTTPRTAKTVVFGADAVEPVYFRGALDRVRFFRAALTDDEVRAEMDR